MASCWNTFAAPSGVFLLGGNVREFVGEVFDLERKVMHLRLEIRDVCRRRNGSTAIRRLH